MFMNLYCEKEFKLFNKSIRKWQTQKLISNKKCLLNKKISRCSEILNHDVTVVVLFCFSSAFQKEKRNTKFENADWDFLAKIWQDSNSWPSCFCLTLNNNVINVELLTQLPFTLELMGCKFQPFYSYFCHPSCAYIRLACGIRTYDPLNFSSRGMHSTAEQQSIHHL